MTTRSTQEKTLRDQAARDAIARDLERNMMVLAGAGAGKTHALIDRMVATICAGMCSVDQMAAITFTRKAAGEMRGRFYLRLRRELACVSEAQAAGRVRKALDDVDQCFIGTIHAFCGRLLRERPIEAGLTPDFTEVDDRDEARLRREVWDRFIQARYVAEDERLEELEEYGIQPEDLHTFFGRRCRNADLRLKESHAPRPDLTPYTNEVREFLDRITPCIPPDPEKRDGLMEAARRARHLLVNHGMRSDRDAAELLAMFEGSLPVTLKLWCDTDTAREIRDGLLPDLQERVVEPAMRMWREHAYGLTTDLVNDAVAFFDSVRQEDGTLTFQDLLLRTAALLQHAPHVRAYFQRRYRLILVDEFQDTDPIQARILFYLTGDDVAETDWLHIAPRPGRLFLVGDAKQSIYRFRRADVEVFRFVASRIEDSGGDIVRLNTSFRSLGRLCSWLSDAFPSIFSADDEPYQAAFEPLHGHRPLGADPCCVRKIAVPKVYGNRSAGIAAFDAERIVGFIAAAMRGDTDFNSDDPEGLLASEASAGDFLILTPTKNYLPVYAKALEDAGIPFDIEGGGRLGESREVAAFVTMLEALRAPDNPVSLVAYLRGPLVGMSDRDLYDIRNAGGRLELGSALPEGLDDTLCDRLVRALDQLERAVHDLATLPPGAAMERALQRTGLLALSAVHPDGGASSRAGNLIRLLSIVRYHAARGWHWGRIVEELRELVEDPAYRVEQMTLESGRQDVVRVMNVHQAKGLQAPVVFLANPYDTSYDHEPTMHVARTGDLSYISMTVEKPRGDYRYETVAQPEGWHADKLEEARFDRAERIRLLYVAATRARNLLVVSQYPPKSGAGLWAPLNASLEDVPDLENHAVRAPERQSPSTHTFAQLVDEAESRLREAGMPTYSVKTVTGTPVDDELIAMALEGRGRDYGVVIHRLFEEAVRGVLPADTGEYVAAMLRHERLSTSYLNDALGALERLKTSTLWQDVQAATEVYTEVPIAAASSTGVVRGVIDLVYRDPRGWHIVDYKTDAAETDKEIEALRNRYAAQLDSYRDYWNRLADEPVVTAALFLVHGPEQDGQLGLFNRS